MSVTTSRQLILLAMREGKIDSLVNCSWFKPITLDDDEESAKLMVRIKDYQARNGKFPTLSELGIGPFDADALDTDFDSLFDHVAGQVRHAERERLVLELSEALTELETFDTKMDLVYARFRELRKSEEHTPTWFTFADVDMERVKWLWKNWIPLETLTVLAGDGGKGKSTICTELAAQLSKGFMPGEFHNKPVRTLMVNAEDSPTKVVKPRLEAADADHSMIETLDLSRNPIEIPGSIGLIEARIEEVDAKFVVIDPFNAFLPDNLSSNNDQQVRAALNPLALMAERTGCAIFALLHTNKQGDIMGSKGFQNTARSVLVFGDHPEDDSGDLRVLAHKKANYGRKQTSQTWEIKGVELPTPETGEVIETTKIKYVDENPYTAEEIMAGSASDKKQGGGETRLRSDFKRRIVDHLVKKGRVMSANRIAIDLGSKPAQIEKYLEVLVEENLVTTELFEGNEVRYRANPKGAFPARRDGTDG